MLAEGLHVCSIQGHPGRVAEGQLDTGWGLPGSLCTGDVPSRVWKPNGCQPGVSYGSSVGRHPTNQVHVVLGSQGHFVQVVPSQGAGGHA